MANILAQLAEAIEQLVAGVSPMLSAIRIGPNRHITGLVCADDVIVTTDQELPALDSYTVVLPVGQLAAARPGTRNVGCNLAVLHLETARPSLSPEISIPRVGSLAVVVGADVDASPTVRLTVIHRFLRTAEGPVPVLDLSGPIAGDLVMDAEGRLIGLAALGPNGEAVVFPGASWVRTPMTTLGSAARQPASIGPVSARRRGWLGVALQPITVPDTLVARAGQTSGRMVMSIIKGGPADTAGLRVGDVLLALNGTSTSGPHTLRAFLESERIGSTVDARLLRDGTVLTTHLTIAVQPG